MTSPIDQLRDWGLLDIENEKCATSECPCDCHDGYQRQCTCPNPPNLPAIVERIKELEELAESRQDSIAAFLSALDPDPEASMSDVEGWHEAARLTTTNKKLREALERIRRMKNARPDDIQGAAWRNGWNDAVCEVRTIAREALKEEEG